MKNFNLIFLLAFAIACGENSEFYLKDKHPHPLPLKESTPISTTVIATPDELIQSPILVVDDGLILTTDGRPVTGNIEVKNIDPTNTYVIEYELEKDEKIKLKEPTRKTEIKGISTSTLPVIFTPDKKSHIKIDNLRITYYKKGEPHNKKVINYPIRGEVKIPELTKVEPNPVVVTPENIRPEVKLPVIMLEPSSVRATTVSGESVQDFGRTIVGKVMDGKVIITNTSPFDIKIDLRITKPEPFRIKDVKSCPEILKKDENCTVDIIFDSKIPGTKQEELLIEHTSVHTDDRRTTRFPIIAVKIEDLENCGGEPCGVPYKEGTLISSEVFSNDVDFGSSSVGVDVKKQVEIQNKGDTALKIKDHMLSDNGIFSFSGGTYPGINGTCGDILLPGSCVVEMVYKPKAIQSDLGSLKVRTKEGPSVTLKLSGKGVAEKICDSFNEYLVVPEKSYPASSVIFPYHQSHPASKAKLSHLYGTQVNSYVPEIKEHTVKDGMVFMTFKLPPMEGEIVNMNFGVNVYKVIRDNYKDTESLCLSSQAIRRCSGHDFTLASWQKLKNSKFWDQQSKPINDLYEKQLGSGENKCGSKNCMALNTTYELKEIFQLNNDEFAALRGNETFSIIFSDDTRMQTMPRIYVKTKISKECK